MPTLRDRCPVCEQPVMHLAAHLAWHASTSGGLADVRGLVVRAQQILDSITARLDALEASTSALEDGLVTHTHEEPLP